MNKERRGGHFECFLLPWQIPEGSQGPPEQCGMERGGGRGPQEETARMGTTSLLHMCKSSQAYKRNFDYNSVAICFKSQSSKEMQRENSVTVAEFSPIPFPQQASKAAQHVVPEYQGTEAVVQRTILARLDMSSGHLLKDCHYTVGLCHIAKRNNMKLKNRNSQNEVDIVRREKEWNNS